MTKPILNNLKRDIKKAKDKLIKKARKGLYENFGQDEYDAIEDKYSDFKYYNGFCTEFHNFFNWCVNYTGEK